MIAETRPHESVLLTDLYQLTMLQGYFDRGMEETAVFEFFVRKLPPQRNFLVAAGLEQALIFLENLRFTPEELEWVSGYGAFRPAFVRYLENLRFTGDVHAMPEGTAFFPNEPILTRDRAVAASTAGRKPLDQPAPLSDLNRLQGSSFGFGSAEQAVGRFRPAPRPWG